ncbi:MAG TPA: cyclic nucleotide-binding domain-containing protein [Rhizomicrobium sp.]|nr:cyclic nucleotide-binding domain-containing protein [Rhizomicrobium sp.]
MRENIARSGPINPMSRLTENCIQPPATLNDHLRSIQKFGVRLRFRRNEPIFDGGDPVDRVYKILSGTVRLCRHMADGRRHVIDFLLAGDLMGFAEFSDPLAAAEAVTEVTLIAYPRSCLDRLARENPMVHAQLVCHLTETLVTAQQQLFVLSCQNAKERIASFLLRLAHRLNVRPGDRLNLTMSRQDIADHMGLTIETVCRAFSALKAEGFLLISNPHQLILGHACTAIPRGRELDSHVS